MHRLRLWLIRKLLPVATYDLNHSLLQIWVVVPRRLMTEKLSLKERARVADHVGQLSRIAGAQAINNAIKVDWKVEKHARKEA